MRLICLTTMGLLLVLHLLTSTSSMAAAMIEFEKTTFDIGKTLEGERVKAVFPFKNTGDAELEIIRVHASCGCTNARATEVKVAPGKSASIEAVFNSAGFRSQIRKSVSVTTNDPNHATMELHIVGEVLPIAELNPPTFNLGDLKPGETAEADVVITPRTEQKFKILRVDTGSKQATVTKFDEVPDADGAYSLKVKVTAGDTPGRILERLSIVTDLPSNLAIRYFLYGNVVPEAGSEQETPSAPASTSAAGPTIEFEKTVFDFGKLYSGDKSTATFSFRNTGKQPLDIQKVTVICNCTKVVRPTILNVPPGKSEKVEITFDSTGLEGSVIKRVLVRTNDPAHQKNLLTITADVQPIAKLSPESINFGWLKVGTRYESTVILTPATPRPFKILKVEAGEHTNVTKRTPVRDGKGSYELHIVVDAGTIETRVMDTLKIMTDMPEHPSVTLLLYGNVVEEIPEDDSGS